MSLNSVSNSSSSSFLGLIRELRIEIRIKSFKESRDSFYIFNLFKRVSFYTNSALSCSSRKNNLIMHAIFCEITAE